MIIGCNSLGEKILSQHNFLFSEVIHFLDTRGQNQDQFFRESKSVGARGRSSIIAQLLVHLSWLSPPCDPFFFGANLYERLLQMSKFDLMLLFTLWVSEQVYGVCLQGLCQI